MRKVLVTNGTALPGFAEPVKKPYQLDYHSVASSEAIEAYRERNHASIHKWLLADHLLLRHYPVGPVFDTRYIYEDECAVHQWMHNTRILDMIHTAGQPQIQVKLPQYISLRRDWIIALNTLIQSLDGVEPLLADITRLLNTGTLWERMDYDTAQTRERLFMLRWFLWQLLKNK